MAIDIDIKPGEDLVDLTKKVGIKAMAEKLGFKSGDHMAEDIGMSYALLWSWININPKKHKILNAALWGSIFLRNKMFYHQPDPTNPELENLKFGNIKWEN